MKKAKVIISCLLCMIMILSALPLSAYADVDVEPSGDLVEEIGYELMTDDELSEYIPYIDVDKAKELGHVVRLEEEEALNSLVFLNMDGSKSEYCFSSNIKYTDENGNCVLMDSSTDLASIPAVMSSDNRSDIDKTVIYTKIGQPQYANTYYYIGNVGVIGDVDYGNGYMLARLNGFCNNGAYADLEPEQIMDVSFKFFGNSNTKYDLMACPYVGNVWEVESATGNNTPSSFMPYYVSYASYSGTSLMYTLDLTEMSKAWLKGEYDSEKGVFITTMLTDSSATSTKDYISVNNNASFSYVVTYADYTTEVFDGSQQNAYGETEPNDSKKTANIAVTKDGTTRQANSVIRGCIENESVDDVDWYAVYLKVGQTVDIKLYNINYVADLDMVVYKIGGGTITSDNNTVGMAEYITYKASSDGWCYIKVYGNVNYDSIYSLYIKRDIRVSGKGVFSSSQSLYAINPDSVKNGVEYMYRLGRDVADSSSKITFLSFNRPAVQINGTQITYGIDSFESNYSFYSLSDVRAYIELFIDGFNDNPDHDEIEELAIMITSNRISCGDRIVQGKINGVLVKDELLYYVNFGKEFAQMIEEINSELKLSDKVKKVVGGFDFEMGYDMTYNQCKAFEDGYLANTNELLYVMADVQFLWPSRNNLSCNDYNFDGGWYASMIYNLCMNHSQLRCIPQISLENRIDGWITFCHWSAQANWENNINKLHIPVSAITPITLFGLDCCNSFNDGGGEYFSLEESVQAFVTAYYQYSTDLSRFKYITWMAMPKQAQLDE